MSSSRTTLITGGAGFIGTNLAHRLLSEGRNVLIYDDLSRAGVKDNVDWLLDQHPQHLEIMVEDVRDAGAVAAAVERADEIYHLAAQVAVTSSLENPVEDFEINARGTLNVLEAMRRRSAPPPLLFTSTNKVYGALENIELRREAQRYVPTDPETRRRGVSERRPLDFHSPYGCSKGAADQYVRDFSRCYGLSTIVFRMSCIYGAHQHGNEDQGWVAHFMLQAGKRAELKIFGDGLQVRDVLYVDDLVDAFMQAMSSCKTLSGRAFNIGGGPSNTLSLLELIAWIEEHSRLPVKVKHASTRAGDQRYYVSDTEFFSTATGWRPRVPLSQGLQNLKAWIEQSMGRSKAVLRAGAAL